MQLVERKLRSQVHKENYQKQVAIDEQKGKRIFAKNRGGLFKRTVFTKNKGRPLTIMKKPALVAC